MFSLLFGVKTNCLNRRLCLQPGRSFVHDVRAYKCSFEGHCSSLSYDCTVRIFLPLLLRRGRSPNIVFVSGKSSRPLTLNGRLPGPCLLSTRPVWRGSYLSSSLHGRLQWALKQQETLPCVIRQASHPSPHHEMTQGTINEVYLIFYMHFISFFY